MRRRRKRKREKAAKAGAEDGEQPQAEQDAVVTAADELESLQVPYAGREPAVLPGFQPCAT